MNLDELRAVQASERSTDSLQSLRDSFYRDVAEYINGLREERARAAERADDPFGSEEVRHLTDEIETAQEVAEAIYDRRLGKVVKRASLAAAGMPTDEDGLTDEEATLFAEVVDEIESRRDAVLSAFAGEAEVPAADLGDDSTPGSPDVAPDSAGAPDVTAANTGISDDAGAPDPTTTVDDGPAVSGSSGADDRVDPEPAGQESTTPTHDAESAATGGGFAASDAMAGGMDGESPSDGPPADERTDRTEPADERTDRTEEAERADAGGATPDGGRLAADRATVRITRDVGEIMGVDEHVYELADGDVVTLPSANAEPLLERDAASRIK